MTVSKRLFDIIVALFLIAVLSPLILWVSWMIWWREGSPVLYRSERMREPDSPFSLWKFRTMTSDDQDSGVSGGDKKDRVTRYGKVLRRRRLDELPQLWNVLCGDISFVGPRPPLRQYVEKHPDLYAQVLKSRPGITGLATLVYHTTEERLLQDCKSAADTNEVYSRRCVPRKATLDLIYQNERSLCWDVWLMFATVIKNMPIAPRARRKRLCSRE